MSARSTQATQRNVRSCEEPDGTFKDYPDLQEFGQNGALNNTKITTGFESRILVDVMRALGSKCVSMLDQCKSLYPDVTPQTQYNWLTSIDQDNKVGLAHTIEQSDFPILYNTPRMCDPGITMSKNWSLTNYIETRLFVFKFKYNYGRTLEPRNKSTCISKAVFDFRPFTLSMRDPGTGKTIYIHQWIEAANNANGFESYTAVSTSSTHPKANLTTVGIFKSMIEQIHLTFLGVNSRGQVTVSGRNSAKPLNLGPDNKLDENIESFMKFIQNYDGVKFIDNSNANDILGTPNTKSALNQQSAVLLTSDVLRMFYFDMFHDEILTRDESFDNFSRMFLEEVNSMNGKYTVSGAPGKGKVKSSYIQYRSLLFPRNSNGTVMKRNSINNGITNKNAGFKQGKGKGFIPQIPAFIKTVGDLAQYIYAGRYDTFVASGDRIGIAVGLYVNAKLGIPVKVMIEDSITGFITYTNLKNVSFKPKMKCFGNSSRSNSCKATANNISVDQFSIALQKGLPNNSRKEFIGMKSAINKKLIRLKRELQTTGKLAGTQIYSGTRASTTARNLRTVERTAKKVETGVKQARRPTPTPTPTPPTNNSARRKTNLNVYITRLQNNLRNKGSNHNFNKNFWLKQLNGNQNTNRRLEIIKNQIKGTYNVKIRELERNRNRKNNGSRNGNGRNAKRSI